MDQAEHTVIKKRVVKMLQEPRLIGPSRPQRVAAPAQARIAERTDAGVVIEVVCGCGQKTYLQCDYAAQEPGKEQQP